MCENLLFRFMEEENVNIFLLNLKYFEMEELLFEFFLFFGDLFFYELLFDDLCLNLVLDKCVYGMLKFVKC